MFVFYNSQNNYNLVILNFYYEGILQMKNYYIYKKKYPTKILRRIKKNLKLKIIWAGNLSKSKHRVFLYKFIQQ